MAAASPVAGWTQAGPSSVAAGAVQTGPPSFVSQPSASAAAAGSSSMTHQRMLSQQAPYDMSTSDSDSGSDSGPLRVPLKLVVQDAVKRWFNETLSEARRGDIKQQALLAQMYAEGYGCKQDLEESRKWAERARCRGYQMSGVYCEL